MYGPVMQHESHFVHREHFQMPPLEPFYMPHPHQIHRAHVQDCEVRSPMMEPHHPMIKCPGGPLFGFVSQFTFCCPNHQWLAPGESDLPPLAHFLYHLLQTMEIPHATLVVALSYIHRLVDLNDCHRHVEVCGHCLATVCVVLASKFLEDDTRPNNKQWAREASMTTQELAAHERTVLERLDYNLNYSLEDFNQLKSFYMKDTLLVLWQKGGFIPLYTPTQVPCSKCRLSINTVQNIQNSVVPMNEYSPGSFTFTPEEYVCFLANRYSCGGFRDVSPKCIDEIVQYDRMHCEEQEYWNILQDLKSCTKVQV
eukprot:comp11660_c0_seq1/m.6172 comp11660_c0_seq1/g.6172  ORF comp11660_c0_seq1/g.6172 comp11660_c0_seq1/m.6172 type:complete len:311 (-) comp11660_c0_seq1:513-1445(-)